MLKKIVSVLSAAALLSALAAVANAAEYLPPSQGDYYLNLDMEKSLPGTTFTGGGMVVDEVSGTIARGSNVVFDAEKGSVKLPGWMETKLDNPITAAGEYAIEIQFMMTSTDFTDDTNRYDVMLRNEGQTSYVMNLHEGGGISLFGKKAEGITIVPMKWYTLKAMLSLPSGTCEAVVTDESGSVVTESSADTGLTGINSPLRFSCTKGEDVNPVYTKGWKFYKNNVGTAESLYPNPPSSDSDYYFNESLSSMPSGKAEVAGPEGNQQELYWNGNIKADGYTEEGAKLFVRNNISLRMNNCTLDTAQTYVMEQDFKIDKYSDVDVTQNLVTMLGNDSTGKDIECKWLSVNGKTGNISGSSVNFDLNKWYTVKTTFNFGENGGEYELNVYDSETGDFVYNKSGTHSLATLTQCLRSVASTSDSNNCEMYIRNFKFYQNMPVELSNFVPAEFSKDGQAVETAEAGTISVTPKIAKTTEGNLDFTVLAVLYEKTDSGVLQVNDIQIKEYSLQGNTAVIWTASEGIDVNVPDDGKDYVIKCFAWDGLDTVKPIAGVAQLD